MGFYTAIVCLVIFAVVQEFGSCHLYLVFFRLNLYQTKLKLPRHYVPIYQRTSPIQKRAIVVESLIEKNIVSARGIVVEFLHMFTTFIYLSTDFSDWKDSNCGGVPAFSN